MICYAPNDKLLDDDLTVEYYYCGLERGHSGAHKSSGYPEWYDDSYHEVNDYVSKAAAEAAQPPDLDLATRALKAMLPPDAAAVAEVLDGLPGSDMLSQEDAVAIHRAADILRGEP